MSGGFRSTGLEGEKLRIRDYIVALLTLSSEVRQDFFHLCGRTTMLALGPKGSGGNVMRSRHLEAAL
jgi:hypothetical protein